MAPKTARLCLTVLFFCMVVVLADDNQPASVPHELPPIETIVLEPVELENTSIWIPANTTGPIINRGCQPKKNCSFSCVLPATVEHSKTESCPNGLGRLLAEYAAHYHEESLPLTIFNGWQWEYSYSLCQFELVSYDLPQRGGCWENSWEVILNRTVGSANSQWLKVSPLHASGAIQSSSEQRSQIEVKTFDTMRTRNGYPKKRQLQD